MTTWQRSCRGDLCAMSGQEYTVASSEETDMFLPFRM